MPEWLLIILYTLMAGAAMPVGAIIGRWEHIRPGWLEEEFRHSVIAFGGGALLSAIALVLVPEGIAKHTPLTAALCFGGGGLAFMALDIWLDQMKSAMSQLVAMLSDFIPEAMALGAAFTTESGSGPLLAIMIALQNVPEGFNAYREMKASGGLSAMKIILAFSALALLGPVAGLLGYFVLSDFPMLIGGIMLFASGGILYLIFQDIAPGVRLERRWAPPLGAVAGFLLGLLGHMVLT